MSMLDAVERKVRHGDHLGLKGAEAHLVQQACMESPHPPHQIPQTPLTLQRSLQMVMVHQILLAAHLHMQIMP